MIAFHCDREGCDSWTRNPFQFLTLTGQGDGENHFCSLDCLMIWAASVSEPTEEIPL